MCGITGVYHFNNSKEVDESILVKMRDSLIHRGPDSAGIYISPDKKVGLGFRRLAIIDLSDAGNQPMANENGTVWIVFNGEIYNFQELRKDLIRKGHRFRSNTDTEVIIHQYEEDGPGCLEKFNGMFAFAIYDEKKEQIFFARDRLGIKPFYYGVQNGVFLFGSEIKAILADSHFKRELNEEAFYHYITFACCPAPYTLFQDIKKLPAGWCGILHENGNVDLWQYWDAIPKVNQMFRGRTSSGGPTSLNGRYWTNAGAQEEYYIEEVRRLLEDSVRGQMVSDVPFGVFLSGGIDSSTNAIFMSEALGHPVETFSIGFRDFEKFNELQYSRQIAEMLGAKKHEVLIGEEELFEFLPKLALHADDPNGDPVCLPVYYVSKLIRDSGVIMAQVGEGADELFAGYDHYLAVVRYWQKYIHWLRHIPNFIFQISYSLSRVLPSGHDLHKEVLRRLANGQEFFWGGAIAFTDYQKQFLFTKEFKKRAKEQDWSVYALIKQYYDKIDAEWPEADFLQKMAYLELKIRLPELLLMRVDKMASAHSIEARVPFLDHRIVELAMQIPMQRKIKNMNSKHILKKAVADKVPANIINRKKQGFGAPVSDWMRGESREQLFSLLSKSFFMKEGYFDKAYIQKMIDDHIALKTDNSFRIWNLITLSLWGSNWLRF